MPRDARTPAEKWRDHRAAFELALELRCTPREAAEELARRRSRQKWLESRASLAVRRRDGPLPEPEQTRPLPWWQRD